MTPETAASDKQLRSNQASAHDARLQYLFIGLGKIQSAIGLSGLVILSTGIVVALFCTVWAIEARVPYPVAIMAGYCTLVGSVCLCAAFMVVQNLSDNKIHTNTTKRQPNYAAWDLVATFRVADASRLWCDIEPGCPATQESIAWAQALLDAIKRGELPVCERADINRRGIDQERANPGWHTQIAREALKVWAKSHGHSPPFLRK
jgi:hypothetical protein